MGKCTTYSVHKTSFSMNYTQLNLLSYYYEQEKRYAIFGYIWLVCFILAFILIVRLAGCWLDRQVKIGKTFGTKEKFTFSMNATHQSSNEDPERILKRSSSSQLP